MDHTVATCAFCLCYSYSGEILGLCQRYPVVERFIAINYKIKTVVKMQDW